MNANKRGFFRPSFPIRVQLRLSTDKNQRYSVLLLALALALLGAVPAGRAEAENQGDTVGPPRIRIEIEPRLGGMFRPGEWTSLRIEDRTKNTSRRVWIHVRDGIHREGRDGIRYLARAHERGQPIVLGGQGLVELHAALGAGTSPVLEIVAGDGGGAGTQAQVLWRQSIGPKLHPLDESEHLVVILNDYAGTLGGRSYPEGSMANRIAVQQVRVSSGALPIRAEGYAPVDLLIIEAVAPQGMLPRQQRALRQWFLGGGRVMVMTARAFRVLERVLLGSGGARSWPEFKTMHGVTDADVVAWSPEGLPWAVRWQVGFGELAAFDLGFTPRAVSSSSAWPAADEKIYRELLASGRQRHGRGRGDTRIDRGAYELHVAPGNDSSAAFLDRARRWAVFFALFLAVALVVGYRGEMKRPPRALALVAGASLAYTGLILVGLPEPSVQVRLLAFERTSGDGRAVTVEHHLWVSSFRDGPGPEITCRKAAPRVLAYDSEELRALDYRVVVGEPSRLTGLAMRVDRPLIVTARWTEDATEMQTGQENRRVSFTVPYKNGRRLARVAYRIPPSVPNKTTGGHHLLAFGKAYPVDLTAGTVGEPVRLKDLPGAAVSSLEEVSEHSRAAGRRTRQRQAFQYALKRLAHTPWMLVCWDETPSRREEVWDVKPGGEHAEFLGAVRAVAPAAVKTEQVK